MFTTMLNDASDLAKKYTAKAVPMFNTLIRVWLCNRSATLIIIYDEITPILYPHILLYRQGNQNLHGTQFKLRLC